MRSTSSGGAPLNVMTDVELSAMIQGELNASPTWIGSDIVKSISQNLDCYNGNPYKSIDGLQSDDVNGDKPNKNQSRYQSNDVHNIVETLVPIICGPFLANEKIATYHPVGEEDDDIAKQQEELMNHAFFKDNPGALFIQDFVRNALTSKIGVATAYWFEGIDEEEEPYAELSEPELNELLQDDDTDLIKYKEKTEDMQAPSGEVIQITTYQDVVIRRKTKVSKLAFRNVNPEDFFVSLRQRSTFLNDIQDKCTFCAERIYMVREDLLDLDISQDMIDLIPTDSVALQTNNQIQLSRYWRPEQQMGLYDTMTTYNTARRPIQVFRVFLRYDSNGDGRSELHEIYYAGQTVLKNDIVSDYIPYFIGSPIPQPGLVYGFCPADEAKPIQLNKTSLIRAMMDNFYFNTIPICLINEGMVSKASVGGLTNRKPGGFVFTRGNPAEAVQTLPPGYAGRETLDLLAYFDAEREERTGVNRMMSGLDSDILNNNKGDMTAGRVMTAAERRAVLMARNLAETALKPMFYYATKLMMQHERKERIFRLRNKVVKVDPRTWDAPKDITIDVGVSNGEQVEQMNALSMVSQNYQILQQSGGQNELFTMDNVYNCLIDQAAAMNLRTPSKYYLDPNSDEAKAMLDEKKKQMAQQQPPVPEQVLMLEAKTQEKQLALDQQKQQFEAWYKEQDINIKKEKNQIDYYKAATAAHKTVEDIHLRGNELRYKGHSEGQRLGYEQERNKQQADKT